MDGSASRRTSQDVLTSWAQLNNELDQVVRCCSPTELDKASRLSLINRVQTAVSQSSAMRAVQIIPYGSFISGIYNNSRYALWGLIRITDPAHSEGFTRALI